MSKKDNKNLNECKKQHIVPQFLQNGFSNNGKLFRHTAKNSFGVNISDNYAENYYYSENLEDKEKQDKTLDKKITKVESNKFAQIRQNLLTWDIEKEYMVQQDLSEFVYHFLLRNKTIIKSIMDAMHEQINNLAILRIDNIDKVIDKFWLKNIKEFALNKNIINKNKIKDSYPLDLLNKIKEQINNFFSEDKLKALREIHEKSLDSNTMLSTFKCQIIKGVFVLPDTVLISYSSKFKQKYLPIIDKNTEYILFPISKEKLLILYKDNMPKLEIHEINNALVIAADSFCSELPSNDNLIVELKKIVGKNNFIKEFNADLSSDYKKSILNLNANLEKSILSTLRKNPMWRSVPIINRKKRKK